ncbi:MAG: rRNA maturation RNase YbeY [Chitinophagaceae bacterium]|nr:rRNA maturation RNase YbeY [Chitinophagaceae bacterium]
MFTNFEIMTSRSKVYFFFEKKIPGLKNRNKLKAFIERLLKAEGKRLSGINYIFCSDKYLLEINRKYLKHDNYTDIITFDLSEDNFIIAEIYISIDRVKANAYEMGTGVQKELHRVIFHGALHLCEYNDKSNRQKLKMRSKEEEYLGKYF